MTIGRINFIDRSDNDISYIYDAHQQIIKTLQLSNTDFLQKFISLCENITSEPYMSISKFLSEHGLNITKFIDEFKNDIIEVPQFSSSNTFLENEIPRNRKNKISDLVEQTVKFDVYQFAQCK